MGIEPKSAGLAERLRVAVQRRGNQKDVAQLAGMTVRTLGRYINGKTGIPADKLQKLAEVCSVSADWLLTGAGEIAIQEDTTVGAKNVPLDDELFGRVVDAIHRLYREERVALAPIDLGRLAARKYGEITAATADPEERLTMIKLVVAQLRSDILSAVAEPGTGKASA